MRLTHSPTHTVTWLAFMFNGLLFALWAAHLPDLQARFDFTHRDLGLILLLVTVGNLLILRPCTHALQRFSPGAVAAAGLSVMAASLTLTALPISTATLAVLAMTFGAGFAASDLSMNTAGARLEQQLGRSVMSGLHGGFSVGLIAGALLSAALLHVGVSTISTYLGAALLVTVGINVAVRYHRLSGQTDQTPEEAHPTARRAALWQLTPLLLLGVSASMIEGVLNDWSTLYLQTVLGASVSAAPLGLAAFAVTMTAGRLLIGDRLAREYGPRLPGAAGSLTVATGLLLILVSSSLGAASLSAALSGFALTGLGLSFLAPLVFSAAARSGHPAALSLLSGVFYTGYLISPALTGLISDSLGLRTAFAVPALLALLSAAVWAAQPGRRRRAAPAAQLS